MWTADIGLLGKSKYAVNLSLTVSPTYPNALLMPELAPGEEARIMAARGHGSDEDIAKAYVRGLKVEAKKAGRAYEVWLKEEYSKILEAKGPNAVLCSFGQLKEYTTKEDAPGGGTKTVKHPGWNFRRTLAEEFEKAIPGVKIPEYARAR